MSMKVLVPEKVHYIIIHCSDTSRTSSVDLDTITRWHKARGFDTIGYHWIIDADGDIVPARDQCFQGAHALGYNDRSIGICYVGGRDLYGACKDTRTFSQKIAMAWLMRDIINYYPDIRYIIGHNDVSTKSCPCFDAKFEYKDFISKIKADKAL